MLLLGHVLLFSPLLGSSFHLNPFPALFVFSHNVFSFRAPNLTFLHRVYFSAFTTNLFSFTVRSTHPRTFLRLSAVEPCDTTWFLSLTPLSPPLFSLHFFNAPFFVQSRCSFPFSLYPLNTSTSNLCVTKHKRKGVEVNFVSGNKRPSGMFSHHFTQEAAQILCLETPTL